MKKILVAEDDKFLQKIYQLKFVKSGYDVRVTSNGQEFLEVLETFTPDIILLDLVMPIKDGFSVLETMAKDLRFKNIPVIVASNLGQEEDIKKAMKLGARDFIVKSDTALNGVIEKIEAYL